MGLLRTAALAAAVACTTVSMARADVIYTFTGVSHSFNPNYGGYFPVVITFDFSNAAIASGSYSLVGAIPNGLTGNPSYTSGGNDLVSMTVTVNNYAYKEATPTYLDGSIDLAFSFDQNGNIASDNLEFLNAYGYDGFSLNGTTGVLIGYSGNCSHSPENDCSLAGSFQPASQPVPEPATLSLAGVGAIALGAVRRKRVKLAKTG